MNRRKFIASLVAVPAGLVAAAKAAEPAPSIWKCVITPHVRTMKMMSIPWFQTTRVMNCSSLAYEDALDSIFIPSEPDRKLAWHERRKSRSRQRLAELALQRPLPLP